MVFESLVDVKPPGLTTSQFFDLTREIKPPSKVKSTTTKLRLFRVPCKTFLRVGAAVLCPADVVWRDAESSCCTLDQELRRSCRQDSTK